jgi:hypothetical protein
MFFRRAPFLEIYEKRAVIDVIDRAYRAFNAASGAAPLQSDRLSEAAHDLPCQAARAAL